MFKQKNLEQFTKVNEKLENDFPPRVAITVPYVRIIVMEMDVKILMEFFQKSCEYTEYGNTMLVI